MTFRRLAIAGGVLALLAGCAVAIRSRTLLEMVNIPDAYWSTGCVNTLVDPNMAVGPSGRWRATARARTHECGQAALASTVPGRSPAQSQR